MKSNAIIFVFTVCRSTLLLDSQLAVSATTNGRCLERTQNVPELFVLAQKLIVRNQYECEKVSEKLSCILPLHLTDLRHNIFCTHIHRFSVQMFNDIRLR